MGKRNGINSKFDKDAFRTLDRYFTLNEGGDLLVRAFNTLDADDRAILLAFMSCGQNKRTLAKLCSVSWPVIDERLWRIQVIVKERYQHLLKEQEDKEPF